MLHIFRNNSCCFRPSRICSIKYFGGVAIISCFLLYLKFWSTIEVPSETIGRINPPKPTSAQLALVRKIPWELLNTTEQKWEALDALSLIVQNQLVKLQSVSGDECQEVVTLECGHWQDCGFGCQVHHRLACLMISYALNIPLIHNEVAGWSYTNKWSDMFQPMGSSCTTGPNTFMVQWPNNGLPLPTIYRKNCSLNSLFCQTESIYHPLEAGLPVPRELGELVELVHERPWIWWIGQFMKYGLRLQPNVKERIEADKRASGFYTNANGPVVGIQIRRTDKITESLDSLHPLEQYLEESLIYFQRLISGKTEKVVGKTVFIASDDHHVLEEAVDKYQPPSWRVLRFPAAKTLKKMLERTEDLYSIVRDISVLAECDFVICGFSSNICRLLYEMLSFRFIDPWAHLKSLDGEYGYVYKAKAIPEKVLKY